MNGLSEFHTDTFPIFKNFAAYASQNCIFSCVPWTAPRIYQKFRNNELQLSLFHVAVEKQVGISIVKMLLEHGKALVISAQ